MYRDKLLELKQIARPTECFANHGFCIFGEDVVYKNLAKIEKAVLR